MKHIKKQRNDRIKSWLRDTLGIENVDTYRKDPRNTVDFKKNCSAPYFVHTCWDFGSVSRFAHYQDLENLFIEKINNPEDESFNIIIFDIERDAEVFFKINKVEFELQV